MQILNHERFEGLAENIDENGCLVVKLENEALRKVFSADVTVKIDGK